MARLKMIHRTPELRDVEPVFELHPWVWMDPASPNASTLGLFSICKGKYILFVCLLV